MGVPPKQIRPFTFEGYLEQNQAVILPPKEWYTIIASLNPFESISELISSEVLSIETLKSFYSMIFWGCFSYSFYRSKKGGKYRITLPGNFSPLNSFGSVGTPPTKMNNTFWSLKLTKGFLLAWFISESFYASWSVIWISLFGLSSFQYFGYCFVVIF